MNEIIIRSNKACQFITEDKDLLRVLRSNLSYKMAGVEYTEAYKRGWNGRTYLVSKKGMFYYGLLFKVEEFLKNHNTNYKIIDERPPLKINEPIDISKNLEKINIIPREYQVRVHDTTIRSQNGIIRACTGSGKAQPFDAKILTPNGWKTMGEIAPGMQVIGSDGKPKNVLNTFPQGKKNIYRVVFSDGTSTECCNDHLWYTSTHNERKNKSGSVKTLCDIRSTIKHLKDSKNTNNHSVPMVKPVLFDKVKITIDPYLLGVLLGNGCLSNKHSVSISSSDEVIVNMCGDLIPDTTKIIKRSDSKYDYYIVTKKSFKKNELLSRLKEYNLIGTLSHTKFIPKDYLYNNIEVRLRVLQGLMDTNGVFSKNGMSTIFYSTSLKLAKDVRFIVQSLGGKAVIKIKQTFCKCGGVRKFGKKSFAVNISMPKDIVPFTLSKKVDQFKSRTKYLPTKYIDKIEFVGKKEAKCILIDSEDHLYVTDDFILTHNTLCIGTITATLNKPTIVYVIGIDLLKQMHDLFTKLFDEPIGFIGDGVCDVQRINIATIWTIGRSLNVNKKKICLDDEVNNGEKFDKNQVSKILGLLEQTKVHIFDECHVVTCDTIQSIHKKINPEHIYGFSGTPYRDDNTDLLINGILGEQIIDVSASELIEKGFLAQPIIKFYSVPKMSLPMAPYQTVYKSYIVDNDIRNNLIVKCTKELLDKKYTPLVLFKQINHGKILHEMMLEQNIKCEMLYGNDSLKRRTEVKEQLEDKKIDVLLASTIFDLGVDIPMHNSLVLCGGGKSSIRALQRLGRVLRFFPNKKYAAVVDFYDQVKFLKKHSMIRYQIYSSEKGFKIITCKEMKK